MRSLKKEVYLRPTAQIHEVAAMRFFEANSRFQCGELDCEQAAELMGVSVSTFYRKRPRRPLPDMMLHQDGSTHEWVPGKQWDLIVTMDDAKDIMIERV
jgi:hypothetical protein